MSYAIVTPVRDEENNLPRLAAALAAQTRLPAAWVVVDDGSHDTTLEILAELGAEHPWVHVVVRDSDVGRGLAAGRREGRALEAFRDGIRALSRPTDVVMKVDADVDFDPGYCGSLVDRFAADRTLGIASGTCLELENGVWTRRTKSESTVWGASRAYRWECVPEIFALEPRMGWDGLDEIRVQLRGMTTATFVDLPFRHNRAEGGRELSSLHHAAALGRASWYMGYRPSYLALRALYRSVREPHALGMIWGYAAAATTRAPRCRDESVVVLLRQRQRLRATLRRGVPNS